MSYSNEICTAIKGFLKKDEWNYQFDEENGNFSMGITLDCKIKNLEMIIDVRDDSYCVIGSIPLKADKETFVETVRLLNRINWETLFGSFEMDESDGEVRYRLSVDCEDISLSESVIRNSIYITAQMANKYGNALAQVIMGFSNANDAFLAAKQADKPAD